MGTAAEAKAECIAAMGEALGTQYAELWQELAQLHITWLEFVELYGTKKSRIELMNRAAPNFFRMIQDNLFEGVALHIARLTDPSKSLNRADRANLTIKNLPALINDPALSAQVLTLCDEAFAASVFARDWRNRHIAHRDLSLALGGSAVPLPDVSLKEVNAALDAFTAVLNAVAKHYLNTTNTFKIAARINGVVELLYVLDEGLDSQEARRKRIEAGDFSDWNREIKDL